MLLSQVQHPGQGATGLCGGHPSFSLYTDHKPLTYLLAKEADAWSACQQRHLAYVAEYTADIQQVPGVENVVADALSRHGDGGCGAARLYRAAAWKDHLPWVLLGMRAAFREESGVSAAETALHQQLVELGQLPPPSERPGGVEGPPAPPAVIPPTRRSYV